MSLAPPVTKDEFSFAGDFYVEASGHNRHRRATVPELKSHFKTSSDGKDHPAHWYEAQLIHYGLKPSKTKGTAKMRLFEAVNGGSLAVPSHIAKVEAGLKKEWAKNEREAKAATKAAAAAPTPAKSTKRKAESTPSASGVFMKSMSVKADGSVNIEFMEKTAKKAKVAATTAASTPAKAKATASAAAKKSAEPKIAKTPAKTAASKAATNKATPAKTIATKATPAKATLAKTTAAKPAVTKAAPVKAPAKATATPKTSAAAPRTKQTARRARGGAFPSASTRAMPTESRPTLATTPKKQTARRGGGSLQGKSTFGSPHQKTGFGFGQAPVDPEDDDPPPPYPGSPMDFDDEYDSYSEMDSPQPESSNFTSPSRSLGLLNGRYNIHAPAIAAMSSGFAGDMGMVLTLEGKALWGSFDFGPVHGIFHLEERPYAASDERLDFLWRGKDEDGEVIEEGDYAQGWISFLGGGRVEGSIYWRGECGFEGIRTSGQETRSAISAAAMRDEWEDYT